MKSQQKIVIKFLCYGAFILLIIWQISFMNTSLVLRNYFNLILIFLLLFSLANHPYQLLVYTLTSGFILDLFSNYNFGIYLCVYVLTIWLCYYLLKKLFTNYSTLARLNVIGLGTIFFQLSLIGITYLCYSLNFNDYYQPFYLNQLLLQCLINLGLAALVLFFTARFTHAQ